MARTSKARKVLAAIALGLALLGSAQGNVAGFRAPSSIENKRS